jgi:hypothetical protein
MGWHVPGLSSSPLPSGGSRDGIRQTILDQKHLSSILHSKTLHHYPTPTTHGNSSFTLHEYEETRSVTLSELHMLHDSEK